MSKKKSKFSEWLAEAIANFFRGLFGKGKRLMASGYRIGKATVGEVADGGIGIVRKASALVGAVPGGFLSSFGQKVAPVQPHQDPVKKQEVASKAANDEQAVREAVRRSQVATVDAATLARRFAVAVVDGRQPPSLAAMPDAVRNWVSGLTGAQIEILAETELEAVIRHLTGSAPLATLPSVGSAPGTQVVPPAPPPPSAPRYPAAEVIRPVFVRPEGGYARPAGIPGVDRPLTADEQLEVDLLRAHAPHAKGPIAFEQSKAFVPPVERREPMSRLSA